MLAVAKKLLAPLPAGRSQWAGLQTLGLDAPHEPIDALHQVAAVRMAVGLIVMTRAIAWRVRGAGTRLRLAVARIRFRLGGAPAGPTGLVLITCASAHQVLRKEVDGDYWSSTRAGSPPHQRERRTGPLHAAEILPGDGGVRIQDGSERHDREHQGREGWSGHARAPIHPGLWCTTASSGGADQRGQEKS